MQSHLMKHYAQMLSAKYRQEEVAGFVCVLLLNVLACTPSFKTLHLLYASS